MKGTQERQAQDYAKAILDGKTPSGVVAPTPNRVASPTTQVTR